MKNKLLQLYSSEKGLTFLSLVAKTFATSMLVVGLYFFVAPKVFASTYVGPTGITFSDFGTVGNAPNGFKDVQMTGGTSHSIWGFKDGTVFGAISYTGSSWIWDNFQATDEQIPDGSYCFDNDGTFDVCDDGEFVISGGLFVPDDTSTRIISTVPLDPFPLSADLVSGDTTIDNVDTTDLYVNQAITSSQFPSGTFIASITDSNTFEASSASLVSGTFDVTFISTSDIA